MRKYLVLAFLIIFISTAFNGYGHFQAIAIQESAISDNHNLEDYQLLSNFFDSKHTTLYKELILVSFVILFFTKSINLLVNLKKRYVILTPVFYQSNYVDTPPLKKNH